jgi:hypothetical protein
MFRNVLPTEEKEEKSVEENKERKVTFFPTEINLSGIANISSSLKNLTSDDSIIVVVCPSLILFLLRAVPS